MTRIGRLIGTGFFSVILSGGGDWRWQQAPADSEAAGGGGGGDSTSWFIIGSSICCFCNCGSVTYSSDTACVVASGFGALLAIVRPRNRERAPRGFANNTLMPRCMPSRTMAKRHGARVERRTMTTHSTVALSNVTRGSQRVCRLCALVAHNCALSDRATSAPKGTRVSSPAACVA